jgi:hypothetical protein
MKKKSAILFCMMLTAILFAQQAANSRVSAPTVDLSKPASDAATNSRQAKYILERTVAALGGDAYLKIQSYVQTGRGYGFYHNESQGVGLNYSHMVRLPDSERYEYNFQRESLPVLLPIPLAKPEQWIIVHIGDQGWETTFRGTRSESAAELEEYNRRRHYDLDLILRYWLPDPKTTMFFEGETIEVSKEVYKVTLLSADNLNVTLYVDRKNFLPLKKTFTYRDKVYKDIQEEAELYDTYRVEQGFNTPHVLTRTKNGETVSQRFIKTVQFNTVFDEKLFSIPTVNYDKMKK